jgi:hypothetical protein
MAACGVRFQGQRPVPPEAEGTTLQIPQALAAAQDPQHRHQQQSPGRKTHPASHPSIRDRLEVADQMEIGCGRGGFGCGKGTGQPIETDEQTGARSVVTHLEAAFPRILSQS